MSATASDAWARSMPGAPRGAWTDLIARRAGLALRDAQVPVLAAVLVRRMRERGVADAAAYFDLLDSEPDGGPEWTELMDRLVSHETSFFRHMPLFDVLRTHVLPDLRRRPGAAGALTFWSAGCSTGQEAYSIAITALHDPAASGAFTVWGADISRRAIDTARRGRYPERAVAVIPAPARLRFFTAIGGRGARQFEVTDELRQRVRFVWSNLYAPTTTCLTFDAIVCQNVLIYFERQAVASLVSSLAARLNPGGYLLLGPGEAAAVCPAGLEALTVNGVRLFRRARRRAPEVRS